MVNSIDFATEKKVEKVVLRKNYKLPNYKLHPLPKKVKVLTTATT